MLEVGSLVDGKYKILRVVGKGGMSVVYQAVNEKANKIWAIKEVRKDGVQNFEVVKQNLVVETDLLKRLSHPNLPSIIDVIDGDGSFLIVMDYIEGNSLNKALENGPQSQDDVIEWSKQLCDVLGYLHSRKPPIIYRDMKPANVMLKPDGKVSLIDFGTAREFKSAAVEDTTCLGTQGYAAPEQYGGHGQTDARTDIYCLGATMYHLVTGHNPSTPPYEMYPIRQWNPELSSGLEQIIIKCTQRNPEDRYQSCAELLYALDHYRDLDDEVTRKRNLKWKLFIASVITTFVMLIGALGFNIARSGVTSQTYDSLVSEADSMYEVNADIGIDDTTYKEAEDLYVKAIKTVDGGNTKAFTHLLNLYLADGKLTSNEYNHMQKYIKENKNELIAKDKTSYYDDLLINFADGAFFSFEASGTGDTQGMIHSAKYYDEIEQSGMSKYQTKAKLLNFLASNYNNSGMKANGDSNVSPSEYWSTLMELLDSPDVASSNVKIKLFVNRFVSQTIYKKMADWNQGGAVSKEEILNGIRKVSDSTKAILETPDYINNSAVLKKYADQIDSNIKLLAQEGYSIDGGGIN